MNEKHLFTNRLIHEKSPYLLQHAHNPVNWYPWGQEAINAAKKEDKPIFLSVGYATCHWCHTMGQESFENPAIAELMNQTFINIKVDREELPEVDSLYMEFAQSMMAGSSGWPLNIILTPSLEPFFAATYLPPKTANTMMGLVEVIHHIKDLWMGDEREKIEHRASKVVEFFAENIEVSGNDLPLKKQVEELSETYFKIADPIYGGLKGAPKFPVGYQYTFLLLIAAISKDSRALFLSGRTLDMMHRGGLYDQIGGGFSRYSVDERWQIPHFEKMLYDNALLTDAYVNAWRFTKKNDYKEVAKEVLDYILREMTHPEGGFFSAEDADSDGQEGLFYIWKHKEIEKVLGKEKAKTLIEYYGVTKEGNFEGENVLHVPLGPIEFAAKHHIVLASLEQELKEGKKLLFEARNKRNRPFKDDKILTSWNGLMIHSMAEAASAFNEPKYMEAAKLAVSFLKTYLWNGTHIQRRWRDGEALHSGGLDDYVFLIRALLTLFEKGEGIQYLEDAIELTDYVEETFKAENGAFFQSNGLDSLIILRKVSFADGAEPSGNAVHTENLLRLYRITLDKKYLAQGEDVLRAVKNSLVSYSPGYFYHVMNVGRYYDTEAPTFIIKLDDQNMHFDRIKNTLGEMFHPYATTVFAKKGDEKIIPSLELYPLKDGKTTLYKCYLGRCLLPITDIHEIIEALKHR